MPAGTGRKRQTFPLPRLVKSVQKSEWFHSRLAPEIRCWFAVLAWFPFQPLPALIYSNAGSQSNRAGEI
jgi:hypothetical protein